MSVIDRKYHNLLNYILDEGYEYMDPNRKGIIRKEVTHYQLEYHLEGGFPALTTKQLYFKGVVGELLWFLNGDTNIKYLNDNNIHIWDKDAANFSKNGDVGRNYGAQWRNWAGSNFAVDQIKDLINNLIRNPMSTRHIVTAWNPAELTETALPPCHWSFEIICFPAGNSYGFNLKWHQRSVDVFLGLPFNIASYALLAHIIGWITGYKPWMIIGDLSHVHLYDAHILAATKQLTRSIHKFNAPKLITKYPVESIEDIDLFLASVNINTFELFGYESYPSIKAEMLATNK
jgi:thymidylate synthase